MATLIFSWIYDRTYAYIDITTLSDMLETYEERMLQHIADTISPRLRRTVTKTESRRVMMSVFDESAEKKRRKEKKQDGRGTKRRRDDETEDVTAEEQAPTIADLRRAIVDRVARKELLTAKMIFAADLEREKKQAQMEDHEFLDPETLKLRLELLKVMGEHYTKGITSAASVRKTGKALFNLSMDKQPAGELPQLLPVAQAQNLETQARVSEETMEMEKKAAAAETAKDGAPPKKKARTE
jgi:hypothetical protein